MHQTWSEKLYDKYLPRFSNVHFNKKIMQLIKKILSIESDVRINTNIDLTIADRLAERLAEELAEGLPDGLPEVLFVSRQLVPIKESYHFFLLCTSQSHIWKPGDTLNLLESVPYNLSCIFPLKNPMSKDFPFPEPNEIKSQRLYSADQSFPKQHHYLPKLSRLKRHRHNLPNLADSLIQFPTAMFS